MFNILATHKVRLIPNKNQEALFIKFSNVARFVYNFSLNEKNEEFKLYGESLNLQNLLKRVRNLKYSKGYEWLLEVPEAIQKQAIKDMLTAYKNFYSRGCKGFPKFKRKGKSKLSFYQRTDKLQKIDNRYIKLTGIKSPIKVNDEILDKGFLNPRVSFDGKYWYLTYSIEIDKVIFSDLEGVLGVDLGIKNLATVSNGMIFKNINKSKKVLRLEMLEKRLQRSISRKYLLNKESKGYIKTSNILKEEEKLRILRRRLRNIRETYIHEITSTLVKIKPKKIVIEDLDVSSMLRNKYFAPSIVKCCFYKFRTFLEYKCNYYGIELVIADRNFPSSKICSNCGSVKKKLSLSERAYCCPNCGYELDRDLNASLNLMNYC